MILRALFAAAALLVAATAHAQPSTLDQARTALERSDATEAARRLADVKDGDQNDIDFLRGTLAFMQENYDAAIDAFTKILTRNPNLHRVRLDLARAYYMAGREAAAEREFRSVLAVGVPPAVAQNVNDFLTRILRRRWEFQAGAGLITDDNANVATTAQSVDLFGLPFHLDGSARQTSGFGGSVNIAGAYTWMLADNAGLKTGGAFYDAEYTNRAFTDRIAEVYAGPRYLFGAASEVTVLGTAAYRWYGGSALTESHGVRIEGRTPLSPRLLLDGSLSWRDQTYKQPQYADYSGDVITAGGVLTYALKTGGFIRGTAGIVREQARSAPLRDTQYIAGVGLFRDNLPGRFAGFVGGQAALVNYDAPLAAFGRTRHDTQIDLRVSISNAALNWGRLTPIVSFIHTERYSNIALYAYSRNRVEFSLSWNF